MKQILSLIALGYVLSTSAQTYTLEQIKDSALHNNIAIRSAKYNIETAQQQRKETFTKFFPNVSGAGLWFNANQGMAQTTLNLSESISPELGSALAQSLPPEALAALGNPISISMMRNGTIGSLMAVQPVFAGGQIINGNKLAKVGEDVSRLQLQLSENEVEKTAEQYFWQLASMQEKMKTVEAVDTLLAGIHNDVDVAVRAGLVMPNDLLQVQLRQNDIQSQRLKLNNGISIVRLLLSQYCGLRDTSFVISYQSDVISPLATKQDHRQALLGTAEYQLLDKQVEAANLQKKLAIGQKAAYFNHTPYFVNIADGGGMYGLDGIRRMADELVDAFNTPKDTKKLISHKGIGCASCLSCISCCALRRASCSVTLPAVSTKLSNRHITVSTVFFMFVMIKNLIVCLFRNESKRACLPLLIYK